MFFGYIDVTCKTTAQADIILLVDGSWSIGRLNFKTIRAFIARMVGVFDIGIDRVQIGKRNLKYFTAFSLKVLDEISTMSNGIALWVSRCSLYLSLVYRSGAVQRRPKDRVASKQSQNPSRTAGGCGKSALQRRKYSDWYFTLISVHF